MIDQISNAHENVSGRCWPNGVPKALPAENEIQVWSTDLVRSPEQIAELAALLADDERQRAAAFRFPVHKYHFIMGRGLLRVLLALYLERPPEKLRLKVGLHGKPCLAGAESAVGLHFNVSHSGDSALYAIARREVGVDLEAHDREIEFTALMERISTPREIAQFQTCPTHRRKAQFFACWTRKEAIAKASGRGLAGGTRTWEICLAEGVGPENRISLHDTQGQPWSVLTLPLISDWSGALAARGWEWQWQGWRLPEGFLGRNRGS